MNNFQGQHQTGAHLPSHHSHLQTQQLNLKSNKSAAQAAVKMLHTNSNVSKNPKLVTDSATAAAVGASSNVGTANTAPERQYNAGQRGKSYNAAVVGAIKSTSGQGMGLGNPRISEKLQSIDGQTPEILKLNTDSMPLSPDANSSVTDNRFALNNGTKKNETKNSQIQTNTSVLQYHHQLNEETTHMGPGQEATAKSNIFQMKTAVNPQSFPDSFHNHNNFRSQNNTSNLNNDFGVDLSQKLNGGAQDVNTEYYKSQTGPSPQINTNTFMNNYNTGQSNIISDGTVSPQNHHEQTQGTAASNQVDTTAVLVGRQKRNRSNNQSILDNNNNILTQDVTLMSPMGIFDDPIDNNPNHPDKDQSTSFDGVFIPSKNINHNTEKTKSTLNRKDRRGAADFLQKKDLQLHTTIRKGQNTGQNSYILSPDQVKFNQENLQQRFEEDDNNIIYNINNGATVAMTNKRRVTGVATADQSLQNIGGAGGRKHSSTNKNNNPDDVAANLNVHIEKLPIKVNTSSIVTLSHQHNQHRKHSQSRTLQRNLDSDMRQGNQNYDQKTRSMLTKGHQNQSNDISSFLQNNYGSFKSVQGASATVGNCDLRGIGQLAAELAQSQDAKKIVNSFTQNDSIPSQNKVGAAVQNSHPSAQRKIESSFNANSYINNSSVAKTSMQKRRNISFGGAGTNNYINDIKMQNQSEKPQIIDLDTSSGVTYRVSRPKPLKNNTHETGQQLKHQQPYLISQTSNVTPHNKLINLTNESRNANGIRSQDSGHSQRNSQEIKIQKKNQTNTDIVSKKFTNSAPQQSHKYQSQQQTQLQQNILKKNANDQSNKSNYEPPIQLFNQYMSDIKQQPQQMPSSLSGICGTNQYSFDSTQTTKPTSKTQKAQIRPGISSSAAPCLPNQRNRHCNDKSISGEAQNLKGQLYTSAQNQQYQTKRRGGAQSRLPVDNGVMISPPPGSSSIAWDDRPDKQASGIDAIVPGIINHSNGQDIDDFSQMIYRQDCIP